MSVVAGGQAARGWDPGYAVLAWLPVYNFALGIWTVAVPAPLIWRGSRRALPAALATLLVAEEPTELVRAAIDALDRHGASGKRNGAVVQAAREG